MRPIGSRPLGVCIAASVAFLLSCARLPLSSTVVRILANEQASNSHRHQHRHDAQIGLIHLGKCGGSSLTRTLRKNRRNSTLAKLWPERFHLRSVPVDRYPSWIGLVRDPVERIRSAWVFEHVQNYRYKVSPRPHAYKNKLFQCYDTLEDLLLTGLDNNNNNNNGTWSHCQLVARQLFQPGAPDAGYGMYHFRYNYKFYYQELLRHVDSKTLYVLRTEHLLDDLNHLEHTLGAPTNTTHAQMTHFTHYTLPNENDLPRPKLELSTAALQRLCTILCDETQIYAQLLRVASNLNEHERQSTLQALRTQCPVSSSTLPCPPNNRLKLSESEQGQLHDTYFQRWGEEHGKDYGGNT